MKRYDQHIDDRLKYADGFKGIIYKGLFERLMPNFCLVDYPGRKIRHVYSRKRSNTGRLRTVFLL
jgi:hypothetical protein